MTMTLRKVAQIKGPDEIVNVHYDPDWLEYRVRVVGAGFDEIYYTDDKADAIATAQHLAGLR